MHIQWILSENFVIYLIKKNEKSLKRRPVVVCLSNQQAIVIYYYCVMQSNQIAPYTFTFIHACLNLNQARDISSISIVIAFNLAR